MNLHARNPSQRILAAVGALMAAVSVALAAYAAHIAEPQAAKRLSIAAAVAFGHGLALVAIAPRAADSRVLGLALWAMLAGALFFSGSLAIAGLTGAAAPLAPFGGSALILAWLLCAVALARR